MLRVALILLAVAVGAGCFAKFGRTKSHAVQRKFPAPPYLVVCRYGDGTVEIWLRPTPESAAKLATDLTMGRFLRCRSW